MVRTSTVFDISTAFFFHETSLYKPQRLVSWRSLLVSWFQNSECSCRLAQVRVYLWICKQWCTVYGNAEVSILVMCHHPLRHVGPADTWTLLTITLLNMISLGTLDLRHYILFPGSSAVKFHWTLGRCDPTYKQLHWKPSSAASLLQSFD